MTPIPLRSWRVTAALSLLSGVALAQDGGDASSVVEAQKTPRTIVIGFEDASEEDCNPRYARYGRCVEQVRFMDMTAAWDAEVVPTELQRAQWQNTARLYSEVWESMAYRWDVGEDPVTPSFIGKGALVFPNTKQQWEATDRGSSGSTDPSVYSLPRSSSWFVEQRWIDPRARVPASSLSMTDLVARPDTFFPAVRFEKAPGLVESPSMVVLTGRFGERLAVDNRLHPYDIMDGDPESSGPLFEQMYPYQRGLEADAESGGAEVPLRRFVVDERLKTEQAGDPVGIRTQAYGDLLLPSASEGYDRMYGMSSEEFDEFYRLVGVQILRFAREEFTHTHLRVLTALMAMHSPPRYASGGMFGGSDLVAAAKGQTDNFDPSVAEFRGFASSKGFGINTKELPAELVDKHIQSFPEWTNPSEKFRRKLLVEIVANLEELLRDGIRSNMDRYLFPALDDASIDAWIKNNSFPGRGLTVQRYFKRIALDLMLDDLDEEMEEKRETEILLDHMNLRIRDALGGPDSPAATPAELEERAMGEWLNVLSTHGLYPDQLTERPGVVDPTAICTLEDRLDALEEPSFKPIQIDQLVVAPGWLRTPEELLWSAREKLPFVMIDDPRRNPPSVTRLVGLPGDQAVYRVRWEVWSGWHMLWGVEPLAESDADAPRRLALRTAALCDDMVLAPPDLVPTLARAALLDGKFRPTVPVPDPDKADNPKKGKSNDQTKVEMENAAIKADDTRRTAGTIQDAAGGDTSAITEVSAGMLGAMTELGKKKQRGANTRSVSSEVVTYLHDLMLTPIREMAGSKPLLVTVMDHGTPGDREYVWSFQPRTPYTNTAFKLDKDLWLRSSAWAWHMDLPETEEPPVLVAPAHLPTEVLTTAAEKQVWKRRTTTDWNFGGGLGLFPYQLVRRQCQSIEADPTNAGFTADCTLGHASDALPRFGAENEGLSFDLFALNTQWLVDDRRFAIEFGPELHLDVLHGGDSFFYDGDRRLYGVTDAAGEDIGQRSEFTWALRFEAGIVVGIRFAPDPSPLARKSGRRLPWGAPLPDGSSILSRTQYGFRTGFLIGPGFGGVTGSALLEGWVGWAVRGQSGPSHTFTPYHPNIVLGPFARVQYGFPLSSNDANPFKLVDSVTAIIGLRAQFRLTQAPTAPEIPTVEAP